MNNNLFFVLISCVSICFTIIVICNGPVINKYADFSPYENCKIHSDSYDYAKKISTLPDEDKKYYKRLINKCNRDKAIYGLEYSSLIMDIFFSFVCCLLGFLNYYGVAKGFEKIIGIVGLASGIICFVMTLVYICYSGYIFTKDSAGIAKLDKDGSYAKWDNTKNKFICIYYDPDDEDAVLAKYSDLGKKQYNYNKDNYFLSSDSEILKCVYTTSGYAYIDEDKATVLCEDTEDGEIDDPYDRPTYDDGKNCEKLYNNPKNTSIENKYKYDRWVTSIIFGVFVIVCSIGLALFGFLIFKDSGSSGHTPV